MFGEGGRVLGVDDGAFGGEDEQAVAGLADAADTAGELHLLLDFHGLSAHSRYEAVTRS